MPTVQSLPETPTEIRLRKEGAGLQVVFADKSYLFSAEFLRVESPSAEVKGHGPGQKRTVPGKQDVRIVKLEPVGQYALRLIFSDGHDTGLYSWSYFREIGENQFDLWQAYLENLEALGLGRKSLSNV